MGFSVKKQAIKSVINRLSALGSWNIDSVPCIFHFISFLTLYHSKTIYPFLRGKKSCISYWRPKNAASNLRILAQPSVYICVEWHMDSGTTIFVNARGVKWWSPGQKQMENLMSAKSAAFLLTAIRGKCLYPTTFHKWHTHDTKEVSGWAFRVNLRFLCEFHVWPFCPHRSSRLYGCFWRKWLSENILTFFWGERIVSDACKADLGSDFNFFTSRATHNRYDDMLNFFSPSLCSCAF